MSVIVRYEPEPLEHQLVALMMPPFSALVMSSSKVFGELHLAPLPVVTELETSSRSIFYRLAYEHGAVLHGAFEQKKGLDLLLLRRLWIFWWAAAGLVGELSLRSAQIRRLETLDGEALENYVRRLARSVKFVPRNEALET